MRSLVMQDKHQTRQKFKLKTQKIEENISKRPGKMTGTAPLVTSTVHGDSCFPYKPLG